MGGRQRTSIFLEKGKKEERQRETKTEKKQVEKKQSK